MNGNNWNNYLKTHLRASFYEAFEPEEALCLTKRFELHYTLKHGSWLNMAEIELSVLSRQCLDRCISNQELLESEAKVWEEECNDQVVKVQ